MSKLKIVGGALLALVIVFVVIGFILPKQVEVTRSIVIDAPPQAVFPHLTAPKKLLEWSPWAERDPNAKWTFEGPESGVGAKYSWEGNSDVGTGSQEITKVVEHSEVQTALLFGGTDPAEAWFKLEPDGEKTRVEWGLRSEMQGGPIGGWFGLLMDGFVGPDYEQGLANLKRIVEG